MILFLFSSLFYYFRPEFDIIFIKTIPISAIFLYLLLRILFRDINNKNKMNLKILGNIRIFLLVLDCFVLFLGLVKIINIHSVEVAPPFVF